SPLPVSLTTSPFTTLRSSSVSLPPFLFTTPSTTAIHTLSLHDALPIFEYQEAGLDERPLALISGSTFGVCQSGAPAPLWQTPNRSEEHTSELQSQSNIVCRLLLEKKKKTETKSTRLNSSNSQM